MRSTLSIFDITRIDIKEPRQDDVRCQHIRFSSDDGEVLDLTVFGEAFIPRSPDTRDLADKTRAACSEKHKTDSIAHIALVLRNADADAVDGGAVDGGAVDFKRFASLYWDLASRVHSEARTQAALDARAELRAALYKHSEDYNQAETTLVNALIQAFNLFAWDPATEDHRFDNTVAAFWEGWGWASALAARR